MNRTNNKTAMPLRLEVANVRAVRKADIAIDGLTVLCGVNGAGKSTLARILQDGIEADLYFDSAHRRALLREFALEVVMPLTRLADDWDMSRGGQPVLKPSFWFANTLPSLDESLARMEQAREFFLEIFKKHASPPLGGAGMREQQRRTIKFVASRLHAVSDSLSGIQDAVLGAIAKTEKALENTVTEKLSYESFREGGLESPVLWRGEVAISEMGERVFAYHDRQVTKARKFVSIRDVVYVESPLVSKLLVKNRNEDLTIEGNLSPLHPRKKRMAGEISDAISLSFSSIMQGGTKYERTPGEEPQWFYHRSDGKKFPLSEVATGIKSFALLSTLYGYGCLNEDTVLIIDEPEAHLHPQWIVEYAKMLVQLVADSGVRVLVASHSPDMVNALQAFARARNLEKRTHFYQAVPAGKKTSYEFKFMHRKLDVGKIFDSFNEVYSAIDEESESMAGGE